MSNNLREAFKNDTEKYRQVMEQLRAELQGYHQNIELLLQEKKYAELKVISHKIRNIAGMLGLYHLKMLSSYWEEICDEETTGNIAEYKANIIKAADEIVID
jgi:HPt (histidine-containing phosphotransfer) domain-containing protein